MTMLQRQLLIFCFMHHQLLITRCANTSFSKSVNGKTPLYVGGFFTFDETVAATARLPQVAQKAIEHINNVPFLLDEYELRLRWGYTKASDNSSVFVIYLFCAIMPLYNMENKERTIFEIRSSANIIQGVREKIV